MKFKGDSIILYIGNSNRNFKTGHLTGRGRNSVKRRNHYSNIMPRTVVCLDTELRKLRPAELYTLGQILNVSDSWKKLMAIVPKEEPSKLPKFKAEHFTMIEQAVSQQRRNAAEIFLDEWGTMGKSRPTLRTLLELLVKAELFRAADYVAADILKEELPKRPQCGPAAAVDVSDDAIRELLREKLELNDDNFNESIVFGSSSNVNINKIIYSPDVTVDAMNDNYLDKNMQSTKLMSAKQHFNGENKGNARVLQKHSVGSRVEMSDLMKFSIDKHDAKDKTQNNQHIMGPSMNAVNETYNGIASTYVKHENQSKMSPLCIYKEQEILSQELPTFLHEFGKTIDYKTNQEMKSDDLPACLNHSVRTFNDTISQNDTTSDSSMSANDSLHISNSKINQKEITSTELPQCVVELGRNSSRINTDHTRINRVDTTQNTISSEEIPIMVLEYT